MHVDRWYCDKCRNSTTVAPDIHELVEHAIKTEYFRCPACEHVDVIALSFMTHLFSHQYRTDDLERCWEVDLPGIMRFYKCKYQPTCTFQAGSSAKLLEHHAAVHNQRPFGWLPTRCARAMSPIRAFPPNLFKIAEDSGARLIGKLYGETSAVLYFTVPIPIGTYAVRSQVGDRLGLARVRHHPSNPAYSTVSDAGSDERELPRAKADLFDTKRKPWTVPFSISFEAYLADDTAYLLATPAPDTRHYLVKIVAHATR